MPKIFKPGKVCVMLQGRQAGQQANGSQEAEQEEQGQALHQGGQHNHLMPTRYALEMEQLKGLVSPETFREGVSQREDAKKTLKKLFEERYASGKNRWFFTPLRF
ncbi:hypothetical protein L7F22_046308 [Adiantum nelumboides]|nr:hypothetical protein [Adiantum nelumboides]